MPRPARQLDGFPLASIRNGVKSHKSETTPKGGFHLTATLYARTAWRPLAYNVNPSGSSPGSVVYSLQPDSALVARVRGRSFGLLFGVLEGMAGALTESFPGVCRAS